MVVASELEHITPLLSLVIISALAILYARKNAVILLPAVMIGSLICRFLGFKLPEVIFKASYLAGALIVFIAGLELDLDFVRRCRERFILIAVIELILYLAIFYASTSFLPLPTAIALMAIIAASNEVFVLQFKKYGDRETAMYGISLSVMEDAFAVFLYTLGVFSSPQAAWRIVVGELRHVGASLIVLGVSVFVLSLLLARPISRLVRTLNRKDAKILLILLYMTFLITISEISKLPEALVVFLGALALAFSGIDREVFEIFESYMILAVLCFVASLPYYVKGEITLNTFLNSLALGFILGIAAFIIRFIILSVATFLSGLPLDRCWNIASTLANTGEFGLIVLSGLLAGGALPQNIALAAMFAYGVNLSLICYIAPNAPKMLIKLKNSIPERVRKGIRDIHLKVVELVNSIMEDPLFKRRLEELVLTVVLAYILSGVIKLIHNPIIDYILSIIVMSVFIVSTYIIFGYFSVKLKTLKINPELLPIIFIKFGLFYIAMYPMLSSLKFVLERGSVDITSPLIMLVAFATSIAMFRAVRKLSAMLSGVKE